MICVVPHNDKVLSELSSWSKQSRVCSETQSLLDRGGPRLVQTVSLDVNISQSPVERPTKIILPTPHCFLWTVASWREVGDRALTSNGENDNQHNATVCYCEGFPILDFRLFLHTHYNPGGGSNPQW